MENEGMVLQGQKASKKEIRDGQSSLEPRDAATQNRSLPAREAAVRGPLGPSHCPSKAHVLLRRATYMNATVQALAHCSASQRLDACR